MSALRGSTCVWRTQALMALRDNLQPGLTCQIPPGKLLDIFRMQNRTHKTPRALSILSFSVHTHRIILKLKINKSLDVL